MVLADRSAHRIGAGGGLTLCMIASAERSPDPTPHAPHRHTAAVTS
jgi:hypothetical protein